MSVPFEVPGFQRNFRLGILVAHRSSSNSPTLGLCHQFHRFSSYEVERNKFLVIRWTAAIDVDLLLYEAALSKEGQAQRYYAGFFDEHGSIPENIIHDDDYFENFRR